MALIRERNMRAQLQAQWQEEVMVEQAPLGEGEAVAAESGRQAEERHGRWAFVPARVSRMGTCSTNWEPHCVLFCVCRTEELLAKRKEGKKLSEIRKSSWEAPGKSEPKE